ncbi:hypothetical protein LZ023_37280 (plasmid) [Pseudomonas silvicola]|nr:hypothetical protein LZ023_37280 [Pseudomonas silvicola]
MKDLFQQKHFATFDALTRRLIGGINTVLIRDLSNKLQGFPFGIARRPVCGLKVERSFYLVNDFSEMNAGSREYSALKSK